MNSIAKFHVRPDITDALNSGRGSLVVALESTIISHGMPYPQNVRTAREVENIIRRKGAIPATIGIVDGFVHIGMDEETLEKFGKIGKDCVKVSRRDIANVIAKGLTGATTVASTMLLANEVGIRIFVTGGIGGVHRGAETSWDVSADLTELGRTPVCVVCAGAKSILDIPKTLEVLETQGVPVVGFKTNRFPAFFTPDSGYAAPSSVASAQEAAALVAEQSRMNLQNGIVLAVPVPSHLAAETEEVEGATQKALKEAEDGRVGGRDVTPFLLKRVAELTGGNSLKANIALVKNNALVGASVAVELQKRLASSRAAVLLPSLRENARRKRGGMRGRGAMRSLSPSPVDAPLGSPALSPSSAPAAALSLPLGAQRRGLSASALIDSKDDHEEASRRTASRSGRRVRFASAFSSSSSASSSTRVAVLGGAAVDFISKPSDITSRGASRTSMPGQTKMTAGGVGRSVAEAISRLGSRPLLLSAVGGSDGSGRFLLEECERSGIDTTGVAVVEGQQTATYSALLDGAGELVGAVAAMEILDSLRASQVPWEALGGCACLVCDANMSEEVVAKAARESFARGLRLWLEPVSVPKAPRLLSALPGNRRGNGQSQAGPFLVKPNVGELFALAGGGNTSDLSGEESEKEIVRAARSLIQRGMEHVLVSLGARGAILVSSSQDAVAQNSGAAPLTPFSFETSIPGTRSSGLPLRFGVETSGVTSSSSASGSLSDGMIAASLSVHSPVPVPPTLSEEVLGQTLGALRKRLPSEAESVAVFGVAGRTQSPSTASAHSQVRSASSESARGGVSRL
uniref:Carbohydrate kinase PfkB domain-containing protein n=1 Tax=Chromera velia CCMP2878 TaxID=1169474 RepID=A0A0G4F959_9ALVE|eukprot:Cvel_15728.t1-p1 / transcript=Cvel_15728.t1 / gene=Cvel_15728 / organism=Chromera_velia_CCMP2878 / gene_product=Pseudouridine-5'-phosphate glycosidase, putative / transcript_product=Pseudouridine-5'-phosphate glycosidase, putative / location=Cvel_scaffold1176:18417-31096(+) / protein_length=802 / sequence_SO=supercontig / SO=protein_coding / is_pseudo=false